MKKSYIFILLSIFILINCSVYIYTEQDIKERVDLIRSEKLNNIEIHYKILDTAQKNISAAIHKAILRNTDALELLENSYGAPKNVQAQNRNKLYNQLKEQYESAKKQGVLQIHFVDKNNISFLRMHKPSKFGDDLTDIREDYKIVNINKKPVRGFVQGRVAHGFRNTFPLFNKKGIHIGAMEVSFSSDRLQWYLNNLSGLRTNFIINKSVLDAKAWQRDDMVIQYTQAVEAEDYVVIKNSINNEKSLLEKKIESIKKSIDDKIRIGEKFTHLVEYQGDFDIISFVPIQNVSQQNIAWLVVYNKSQLVKNLYEHKLNGRVVAFIFSIVVIGLLYLQFRNLSKLEHLNTTLNTASKVAKIGFWEYNAKNHKLSWSDGVYELLEIENKNIAVDYEKFLSYVDDEDKDIVDHKFQESIRAKKEYFVTHRVITEKQTLKYVQERATHYYSENGELERSIGSIYDITEKYFSDKKFRDLLDYASDGIHILDENGDVVECSHSFASNLGYTREEVKKLNVADWEALIPKEKLLGAIQTLMHDANTFESKHKRKDGSIIDVQISAKGIYLDGKKYLYSSQRDISQRKKSEELLLQSKKEQDTLLSLFDISDSVLFKWNSDENWSIEYVSKNVEHLLGYTYEELISSKVKYSDCICKDDKERVFKEVADGSKSKDGYFIHKPYRIITKDGQVKWVYDQTVVEKDEDGNIIHYIGYIFDITKDKESEIELATIFDTALEGIAVLDMDTKFVKVNNKYTELLGYPESELKGMRCSELTDADYISRSRDVFEKVLKKGNYENFERFCIKKDGEKRRLRSSVALMPNKKEFLMTTVDVTELYNAFKKIQKQSLTDELTGLQNRKAYNQRVDELLSEFKRYKTVFSFLMFDIDYFKSINDKYGHDAGDKVLVKLSEVVNSVIRKNDYIYRVGGEEFVILLSNTDLGSAKTLAEKLRERVEKDVDTLEDRSVTISVGVSEVREYDTVDSIFKRADDNLYKSKDNGRNTITCDV
jgi:diguanylate cyclase (GGDEF)-like protein/PAS domain S-box-containing protein